MDSDMAGLSCEEATRTHTLRHGRHGMDAAKADHFGSWSATGTSRVVQTTPPAAAYAGRSVVWVVSRIDSGNGPRPLGSDCERTSAAERHGPESSWQTAGSYIFALDGVYQAIVQPSSSSISRICVSVLRNMCPRPPEMHPDKTGTNR